MQYNNIDCRLCLKLKYVPHDDACYNDYEDETDQNGDDVDDDDLQVNGFGKEGLRLDATLH